MVVTVIDGEWTVDRYEHTNPYTGKVTKEKDGSPYNKQNKLVSLGVICSDLTKGYAFFEHKEIQHKYTIDGKEYKDKAFNFIQEVLDKSTLLVGHNLKADIQWILESGFTLPKGIKIFDTFIFEYVIPKEHRLPLDLGSCCERRGVTAKLDILKDYFNKGYNTDEIPFEELYTYGMGDIISTSELFNVHKRLLKEDSEIKSMAKILKPMNEFALLLTDMEIAGVQIDTVELDKVEKLFLEEKTQLKEELNIITREVMGDTPINLNSPEQISQVVFGIKVIDKSAWVEVFNIGVEKQGPRIGKKKYLKRTSVTEIKRLINLHCKVLYKTEVNKCTACYGRGTYQKFSKTKVKIYKRDYRLKITPPTAHSKEYKCKSCLGSGVYYKETTTRAGLKVTQFNYEWAAEGGFSVGGTTIDLLLELPISNMARTFLSKLGRYNSVTTYLNNFVGGIKKKMHNNVLHINYNQCLTLTGRLSSTFHNLPRGNTFPVKKAIVSRWQKQGGKILDCDFGQLEFRVAALLSKCPQATKDILKGTDVHMLTRDTLLDNGFVFKSNELKEQRQESKSRSFLPLYGGQSGTEPEVAYFKFFLEYFYGIDSWQQELGQQAIMYKKTQTPSGRIYSYPYAKRQTNGRVYSYTQICNYPVQGFGFDIVMVTMLELKRLMEKRDVRSKIILTVHDSVTCDIYPNEEKIMIDIYNEVFHNVPKIIEQRFGLECNVPLTYDLELGDNWMDKKEVKDVY